MARNSPRAVHCPLRNLEVTSKDLDWNEGDVVKLLAHLDLLVEHPKTSYCDLTDSQREEIAAARLGELSEKLKHKFSPIEIEDKLYSLFKEGQEQYPEWDFWNVIQLGSVELHVLDDDIKDRVEKELCEIRRDSPRKRQCAPKIRGVYANSGQGATIQRDGSAKRNKKSRSLGRATASRTATPCERQPKTKSVRRLSPSVVIATPFVDREAQTDGTRGQLGEPVRFSGVCALDEQPNGMDIEAHAPIPADSLSNLDIATIVSAREKYEDICFEAANLRKRMADLEKENKSYQREHREFAALMSQTQGISPSVEAELMKMNKRIAELESEVKRKNKRIVALEAGKEMHSPLHFNTYPPGKGDGSKHTAKLLENHGNLRRQLMLMSTIPGLHHPAPDQLPAQGSDLQSLISSTTSDRPALYANWTTNDEEPITANDFVQCLTGAAVREWVFRDQFRCVATIESVLLDEYRTQIASHCGETVVHDLDFAAHRSLVNKKQFRDIDLKHAASRHANRLRVALEPYICSRKAEARLEDDLEAIFWSALDIKMLVMVGKDLYECIWPVSNSVFENASMETERSKYCSEEPADATYEASLVRLPLVPGLRAYEYEKGLVDYHGFKRDEDRRTGTGTSRIIAKAIVLL